MVIRGPLVADSWPTHLSASLTLLWNVMRSSGSQFLSKCLEAKCLELKCLRQTWLLLVEPLKETLLSADSQGRPGATKTLCAPYISRPLRLFQTLWDASGSLETCLEAQRIFPTFWRDVFLLHLPEPRSRYLADDRALSALGKHCPELREVGAERCFEVPARALARLTRTFRGECVHSSVGRHRDSGFDILAVLFWKAI